MTAQRSSFVAVLALLTCGLAGVSLAPDGRHLFFASNRSDFEKPLDLRLGTKELAAALHRPGNGLRDIYRVDVSALGLRSPCGSER